MNSTKGSIISILILNLLVIQIVFSISIQGSTIEDNNNGYIDITVTEALEMLNTTEDGIQYPIDVRTDSEWKDAHINTPYPEYARHHNFYEWEDSDTLDEFLSTYQGTEIIVYCRTGGRSVSAANILIDNDFDGIIYNMVGGITQWKSLGYPTIPNRPAEKPVISGPSSGTPNEEIEFTITAHDPDYDHLIYLINWSDGSDEALVGPYDANEAVKINHTWTDNGIYIIQVKAVDPYGGQSEWTTFEFSLAKTELNITNMKGGFGSVIVEIKNIGSYSAEEIKSTITIYGGVFSKINLTHTCVGCDVCGTILEPGSIKTENTRESGIIFGLGPIEVTATAWANNAEIISEKMNGFVFGPVVILH